MKKLIITLSAILFATLLCTAKTVSFKYDPSVERSEVYSVNVNGHQQTVLATAEPDFCIFDCDSPVTVTVRTNEPASRVDVRPLSLDFKHKFKNGVLTLTMKPKDRVVIEFDGNYKKPLFVFANEIDRNKPGKKAKGVQMYRAGKVYDANDIKIKDGETLYIEGGAVLRGNIKTSRAKGIKIAGSGILDARQNSAYAVRIIKSEDISIKGITVLNAIGWTTYIAECKNIDVDNYKVIAEYNPKHVRGLENDGLNFVSSSYAKAVHCLSYCHDDAYCVKTGAFKTAGKATDISFEDCIAWNVRGGNSMEIGYCVLEDIENISFKNIYSIHKRDNDRGSRNADISIHCAGKGTVRNVSYENIYLEEADNYTVHFNIFDNKNSMKAYGIPYSPGHIENVTLKNIRVLYGDPKRSRILGYDEEHKVQNVTFEDFFIQGKKVTDLEEAGFVLKNYSSITTK